MNREYDGKRHINAVITIEVNYECIVNTVTYATVEDYYRYGSTKGFGGMVNNQRERESKREMER